MSAAQSVYLSLEERKISLFADRLKMKKEKLDQRPERTAVEEDEDCHFIMSSLPKIRQIKDKIPFHSAYLGKNKKKVFCVIKGQ